MAKPCGLGLMESLQIPRVLGIGGGATGTPSLPLPTLLQPEEMGTALVQCSRTTSTQPSVLASTGACMEVPLPSTDGEPPPANMAL